MNAHTTFTPAATLDKLDALIAKAMNARDAATNGTLFDSNEGRALVNAAHDLFEVDGLYDLAEDNADTIAPMPSHDYELMAFRAAPYAGWSL